ncbi:ribosomal protein S8 [Chytriomyces sp. MP71]|nr:ribosomal protein S8 [Chytriomyces sp. MP71]
MHWHLSSHVTNAFRLRMARVAVPESKQNQAIANILHDEGFVAAVQSGDTLGPYQMGAQVPITPDNGEPVLHDMRAVSKPSRRVFATAQELKMVAAARRASPLLKGAHVGQVTILKTAYGIVELKDALKKNVGGEVLCIAK